MLPVGRRAATIADAFLASGQERSPVTAMPTSRFVQIVEVRDETTAM